MHLLLLLLQLFGHETMQDQDEAVLGGSRVCLEGKPCVFYQRLGKLSIVTSASSAVFAASGSGAAELEGEPGLEAPGGQVKAVEKRGEGEDGINRDDKKAHGLGHDQEADEVQQVRPVDKDIRIVPHCGQVRRGGNVCCA